MKSCRCRNRHFMKGFRTAFKHFQHTKKVYYLFANALLLNHRLDFY
jgi:hypothetical protein